MKEKIHLIINRLPVKATLLEGPSDMSYQGLNKKFCAVEFDVEIISDESLQPTLNVLINGEILPAVWERIPQRDGTKRAFLSF